MTADERVTDPYRWARTLVAAKLTDQEALAQLQAGGFDPELAVLVLAHARGDQPRIRWSKVVGGLIVAGTSALLGVSVGASVFQSGGLLPVGALVTAFMFGLFHFRDGIRAR